MAAFGVHASRPASRWEDAHLTANGRHGALVFGDPYDETVIVTHHQLTYVPPAMAAGEAPTSDRRAPLLAGRLDEARDLILAGEPARALARFSDGRGLTPIAAFHPALAIRLRMPAGTPSGYRRDTDYTTGVVTVGWTDTAGTWQRTCFVSRADDVVVLRVTPPNGVSADPRNEWLSIGHDVMLPGAPDGLAVDTFGRRVRGVRVGYPTGGGYLAASRVLVGNDAITVLHRVARLRSDDDAETRAAELEAALSALDVDHDELLARHRALHQPAFERCDIELRDVDARRHPLTDLAAAGRYHLLSASGLRPPRLVGLWQGDWQPAWAGALTLDANLPLALAGAVTANVPEAVEAVAALVDAQLDDWRVNARRIFGTRGAVAPAHTDGENGANLHFNAEWPLQLWTAGADWLLVTLLDHVAATGDEKFLRKRVLPLLTDVATFYEDFLTRVDETGHAVFVPSYSPENAPSGSVPAAINATMDIAAARHALLAAAEARTVLDAGEGDDDAPSRWRALAERLPPYRVNGDGALAEWAWPTLGDSYDHRHVSHLYPVWPLHEIMPSVTPELADAALRALRRRGHENDSAHGYLHQALVAARLRQPRLAGELLGRLVDDEFFFDNLMSSHYPRRTVFNADATCALPGLLIELLVDSWPGVVELLPAVPDRFASGHVHGVRTRTRVTVVDLRWDLPAGTASATLLPEATRRLTVRHAGATRQLDGVAGTVVRLSIDLASATIDVVDGGRREEPWPRLANTNAEDVGAP